VFAVIGLGNPGSRYAETRHNAGFMVVDELASRWSVDYRPGKGSYVYGKSISHDALLVKPTTFMNHSGQATRHLTDYFDIDLEHTMLVFDDLDLEFPALRIRKQGGAGTHRGMQSVIQHLGTDTFPRTRLGIGGDQGQRPAEVFVLEKYTKQERELLPDQINRAADAIEHWLREDIEQAMTRFNTQRDPGADKEESINE